MKILKEHVCGHNSELGLIDVVVEESRTNFYVTAKPVNYELPIMVQWKVTKKQESDWLKAYHIAFNEWRERNKNLKRF